MFLSVAPTIRHTLVDDLHVFECKFHKIQNTVSDIKYTYVFNMQFNFMQEEL